MCSCCSLLALFFTSPISTIKLLGSLFSHIFKYHVPNGQSLFILALYYNYSDNIVFTICKNDLIIVLVVASSNITFIRWCYNQNHSSQSTYIFKNISSQPKHTHTHTHIIAKSSTKVKTSFLNLQQYIKLN
jgi:hypothetical protein